MANGQVITTDDAKLYALWLSGEPQDGTSDYDGEVLNHMQTVLNTLVNGGTLGTRDIGNAAGLYEHVVDIPTTDWLWLRKFPPFAFVTTPAFLGSSSAVTLNQGTQLGTIQFTYGSNVITFSIAPSTSVVGFRISIQNQAQGVPNPPFTVPRIATHVAGSTTATIDTTWNQETQSISNFVMFQAEYTLPTDFVRFCESPMIQGGWTGSGGWGGYPPRIAIGSYEQVFDQYPMTEYNQGPPSAAARLNANTLMMNRWDTFSYRVEFSYIMSPPPLVIGAEQIPVLPERFRHLLSMGAAMLIMNDKVDQRAGSLSSQFREILAHMGVEYRKEQNAGSEWSGRHLTRMTQRRRGLLRTTSGLPLF